MSQHFLDSSIKQLEYYKLLGEKTFDQVSEDTLFKQFSDESNSITMIVQHLCGNMLSRWTDFLTMDGEKETRNRDSEFEQIIQSKVEMLEIWNKGWNCCLGTLSSLKESDLDTIIYIRNMGCTVMEAIQRQLCHYPYHIGQIVYIGKMSANKDWKSLSIPKGDSKSYNAERFEKPKSLLHFTEELKKKK
jgi:Protein of unknown function (DUF1572)